MGMRRSYNVRCVAQVSSSAKALGISFHDAADLEGHKSAAVDSARVPSHAQTRGQGAVQIMYVLAALPGVKSGSQRKSRPTIELCVR